MLRSAWTGRRARAVQKGTAGDDVRHGNGGIKETQLLRPSEMLARAQHPCG